MKMYIYLSAILILGDKPMNTKNQEMIEAFLKNKQGQPRAEGKRGCLQNQLTSTEELLGI